MGGGEIQVNNGFKDDKKKKRRFRRKPSKKNQSPSSAEEALSVPAVKHSVPCSGDVAATEKLYMWPLLKKNEILYSEARVLVLGPMFMCVYIPKLAMERRIYYNEVEGLIVEWLDATSTLLLSLSMNERPNKKTSPTKSRPLEETAVVVNPIDLELGEIEPSVFPLTVHLLSTVPIALHAIGGGNGSLDFIARLYTSSYFP